MDGQLMNEDASQGLQAIYLVIEPDPLLRADLAEILVFGDPSAQVISAASVQVALPHLTTTNQLRLALVTGDPQGFAASPLGQMIAQKGGKVVLMGDKAEAEGQDAGYPVLERPFSQNQVLALLRK